MTTTYTWSIVNMERLTADNFVVVVHYNVSATDDTYQASTYGTTSYTQAKGLPYIPYADVTMQEVLDWCYAAGVDKDATEVALAQQIALQKNPVTATGTPWSTT